MLSVWKKPSQHFSVIGTVSKGGEENTLKVTRAQPVTPTFENGCLGVGAPFKSM